MAISQQQRGQILEIYRQEIKISKFFLFEEIPPEKLKNARRSYASLMGDDEAVIFLFDDTLFGSSKEGFLLTTNCLYSKNFAEKGSSVKIENISNITLDHGKLSSNIVVQTTVGLKMEFQVTQAPGRDEKTALIRVLNKTAELLKGQTSTSSTGSGPLQCRGCGSAVNVRAVSCEYCGTAN